MSQDFSLLMLLCVCCYFSFRAPVPSFDIAVLYSVAFLSLQAPLSASSPLSVLPCPGAPFQSESCPSATLRPHLSLTVLPLHLLLWYQVEYTPTQLDFLALLFTVVKLLYIGGALPRCARVVHLLDAASRASAQELHKTLIRNEAAYFGCVKQLVLQHPPPPQPQAAGTLPLYLCGDSHCLSGQHTQCQYPCLCIGSGHDSDDYMTCLTN